MQKIEDIMINLSKEIKIQEIKFYTDNYNFFNDDCETAIKKFYNDNIATADDHKKYYRDSFKQNLEMNNGLNIIDNQDTILGHGYDRVIQVFTMLNDIYDIPKSTISKKQWNVYIDSLNEYCQKHKLDNTNDQITINLVKMAVAYALVYNQDTFDFDDLVDNLKYISYCTEITEHNLEKDNALLRIKIKINSKLKKD